MKTVYVVLYNNAMVFAFTTNSAAESYIQRAVSDRRQAYTRGTLTIKAVDLWLNYPHVEDEASFDSLAN